MKLVRYAGILSLVAAAACSGGGGSTGLGGGGGDGGGDPYGGGSTTCPTGAICLLASTYSPKTKTISPGTTVDFVNNSNIAHTVNFDGTRPTGATDIPLHSSGTNSRTFNEVGKFAFHCTQHAGMTGEITVQ